MAILTKNRLTALTEGKLDTRTFSQVFNEAKSEHKSLTQTSIFLSHSHEDLRNGTVQKSIVFLRRLGLRIYIDSEDSNLSPFTNADTARLIKQKIINNNKFIFLATDNAINSKWCNWELGFGDAHKYIDNIALFPVSESAGTWTGNEYLRIYPRIEESNFQETYKIIFPTGTEISLGQWLLK
ncbi:MAG: toll/interleukin-1 receptor domain-containing protein [Sediminibacterium sp.]